MNEKTRSILNFDPIAAAEALIGKQHEDWDVETDGMAALGVAMATNQAKKEHLESIGDTHFGITWQSFIEIAKTYGFKSGYCQKFTGTGWSGKGVEEEEIIFFHEEKGLILYAESYNGKSVNNAKVYGEVKISENIERNQWNALNGCSHSGNGNGTMSFDVDVREGFRFHLDALSEAFEFSKTWTKVPFLWFLNYMDTKNKSYDYEKISMKKIKASTPEISKIILGK